MKARKGPLSPENLLDTAPELALLFNGQQMRPMTPQDIAGTVLGPIPEHLPTLVKAFLHRGLACIAYSGFYNLLATVGTGQFGMAAEAAIREYASQKGLDILTPKGTSKGLHNLIQELHGNKFLTDSQKDYWLHTTKIRNFLLHPEEDASISYGHIFLLLSRLTEETLILFPHPEGNGLQNP